jgi:glycyl-tRNA synthetase
VEDDANVVYLRPETCQGIFVNFQNVQTTTRKKIPFGIAQVGKSFRNEITTGNFLFRVREFEQMEMEFFVKPGTDEDWFEYWLQERINWYVGLGINRKNLEISEHPKEKLSHYSKRTCDIMYRFPMGFDELEGVANRTGFLAFLCEAYEEEPDKDEIRTVLHFHPDIAPIKVAILPLSKKENLAAMAKDVYSGLRTGFMTSYDDTQSIGRRYRRQDELGTPYCVTVDFQSLEDNQVTIRERDSMAQIRIPVGALQKTLAAKLAGEEFLILPEGGQIVKQ